MSGSRSSMRKRKVVRKSATKKLFPIDVEEFCAEIINAGARLADLVIVEYPNARLVDDALFAVTEIVECFGLKGQWVTSRESSARNEFLANDSVREVSGCVAFIDMTVTIVSFTFSFIIDYLAGGNRLRAKIVLLP